MFSLLTVSLWHSGRVSAFHKGDTGFEYTNIFNIIFFVTEFGGIKGKLNWV